MFAILLRKPFLAGSRRSPCTFVRLLHDEPSSKTSPSSPESDLAVSFFKTSCGLPPSSAIEAAAKINIKTTANAESVLRLLQTSGFTKSNIARIASKIPVLFSYHPDKCIKPKLDLFTASGFHGNFIAKILSQNPGLLLLGLEKLSTNLHLLMNTLGGDSKTVATSIARSTWILSFDVKKYLLPNTETLREHGVAGHNIARLITWWPRAITQKPDRFRKTVTLLEDMGFDPSNQLFIQGIQAIIWLTPSTWQRKLQVFGSVGWSQEETLSAFKKNPLCMIASEEKVRKVMAFFVENLKWEPSRLALLPTLFKYSLEKRIVPRYAVFNILSTSGLSGTNICFPTLLNKSDSDFLKKYVCKYSSTLPQLLEVYKVKLDSAVAVPSTFVL